MTPQTELEDQSLCWSGLGRDINATFETFFAPRGALTIIIGIDAFRL